MRLILLAFVLAAVPACGKSSNSPKDGPPADAAVDAPLDASCFTNPQTHYEIINACTTAQQIFITTKPPLQNPDGTLPHLP
jgi:hypothetical protein